ncbi:MAG: hypothetical protein U1E62_05420 [Alsobacter sp.]
MRNAPRPSAALALKGIFTVADLDAEMITLNSRRYPMGRPAVFTGVDSDLSVPENQTAVQTIEAIGFGPIGYEIVGGADAAAFQIDPESGDLTFASAPNFESPGDADGDNIYEVRVGAGSQLGVGKTNEVTIRVTVTNANEAPVITSSATWSVTAPATAVGTMTSTDPDAGATKTWSISGGAQAALFQIDASTGVLSFKSASTAGSKAVTVAVSDGTNTTTKALTVTVS